MSKKRTKKKKPQNKKVSPSKYIIRKGRELEVFECRINQDWEVGGLSTILVSKKMPSGRYVIGVYLIDNYCLGLKNTFYRANLNQEEYDEMSELAFRGYDDVIEDCSYVFANNLIYGAIDYATELGFSPNKDFIITEHLLDSDLISDEINEIEFGKEGQPYYCSGPYDNVNKIINTLNKNVGEGNYHFLMGEEQFDY